MRRLCGENGEVCEVQCQGELMNRVPISRIISTFLQTGEIVNLPEPDQSQIDKEEADFQRDLKCLPERKKRAFLRFLQKFHGKNCLSTFNVVNILK